MVLRLSRIAFAIQTAFCILLAAGCGGSSSSSLTWAGSNNGTVVLDANGASFIFASSTGCAQLASGGAGPAGFCLAPNSASANGFAAYGSTACITPLTSNQCNAPSFEVVLTNNPGGAGCIAVLGDGSATQSVGLQSLAVTSSASGFSVQTDAAPTAFAPYWNGIIPACGGSNAFAGDYSGTVSTDVLSCPSGSTLTGNTCCSQPGNGTCLGTTTSPTTTSTVSGTLAFAVDSGGLVNDNTKQIVGTLSGTAIGDVITEQSVSLNSNYLKYTVATAAQGTNGKWTIAGTAAAPTSGGPDSFSVAQQ